ncbi:MAG TPA: hypothetical protein EYQ83_03875 [Acidobacteria bacterium]|nr:hypothetical protein [Acidobacteriota bacterium]
MLKIFVIAGVLGLWSADLALAQRRVPVRHARRGHVVRVLPRGHASVTVRGVRGHSVGGTFYRPHSRRHVVVAPPVGARVAVLPRGAVRVTRRGISYYRHHNVHYRPVISNGTTIFFVARL